MQSKSSTPTTEERIEARIERMTANSATATDADPVAAQREARRLRESLA